METLERIGFIYSYELRDKSGTLIQSGSSHNLMPDEATNYLLSVAFTGGYQWTAFYLGLYQGRYTPHKADKMATFPEVAEELTDYLGQSRLLVNFSSPNGGQISNLGERTVFEFTAEATLSGCFLSTASSKGSSGGVLISAARMPSPMPVVVGQTLTVTAGIVLISN